MTVATTSQGVLEHASQSPSPDRLEVLRQAIAQAAKLLPTQRPITVFIAQNPLQALEDLPFDEGAKLGGKLQGCQYYLSEADYRERLAAGRFQRADLLAVLSDDLGDTAEQPIAPFTNRIALRLAMLEHDIRVAPTAELRWFVAETDALQRFRNDVGEQQRAAMIDAAQRWVATEANRDPHADARLSKQQRRAHDLLSQLIDHGDKRAPHWSPRKWEAFTLQLLWRICRTGVHGLPAAAPHHRPGARHRDLVFEVTGTDTDLLVHDVLVRFCAAFLDQGIAQWPLPHRELGFYRSFLSYYREPAAPADRWLRGLRVECARLQQDALAPLESIAESLAILGAAEDEVGPMIAASLLALRGWAGMLNQLEQRHDLAVLPVPEGSLIEFLAVRLILERHALQHVARETLDFRGPLAELRTAVRSRMPTREGDALEHRAFVVFQLAQLLGWNPIALLQLTKAEWSGLIREMEAFPSLERRRLFQAALERNYRLQALDAMAVHAQRLTERTAQPRCQVLCCLDDREESLRRHLEEIAPDIETFGAAGFFNIPMFYRGAADAHFTALCPIVIRPERWVVEDVAFTLDRVHGRRARMRRMLGKTSHQLHVGTRTLAGGAFITGTLGALASVPLVARVLFPRLTAMVRRALGRFVEPPAHSTLRLQRRDAPPGPEGPQVGFSPGEMADMAERLLRDVGITERLARVIVVLGHGSSSQNNPHNSAYDCGACGGGNGGPNARAIAAILNDDAVRAVLAQRNIIVPADTVFVGGWHNTCNDEITYFDLDHIPQSHHAEFARVQANLVEACQRNAHERCRRFESAPPDLSYAAAKRHVEVRSEDLAQVRPEWGHATNALCIVGRRARTQGLFLDRRTFLTSYDPSTDDADHSILARLLQAAVPVCSGINLAYYFFRVDPIGWGSGSKLPHNITSLLGVMDGAASDLRTGLPWQGVELHDPLRLMYVIEATPSTMSKLMDRHPTIGKVFRNGWSTLATLDPTGTELHLLTPAGFERYSPGTTTLPVIAQSSDWYQGSRDNLGFATIQDASRSPGQDTHR
jgi:uncharacterized protein YbcC (UPF0753/DUF2309 family)